jgi:hypothetical protein
MIKTIAIARTILFWVAASYVLSAALLGVARMRHQPVPAWVILGWLATGAAGMALSLMLSPGRSAVWLGLLVLLGPWMLFSLVEDLRRGFWPIALTDLAGIAAIGYSLAICARDVFN